MNIARTLAVILIIPLLCTHVMSQEKLTARDIADLSFEATKLAGAEATSTMTIIDGKGRERVRQVAQVTKLYDGGDTEKKLVRFLYPADVKGTGLLTYDYKEKDDDIWLYMPALRKTRRIISSEKAKSFMGSEFSYADMTPPTLDDFTFELLGEEKVNEVPCWVVEMVPTDDDVADENGFSKKISYIGKGDYVIRKAIYFDLDGQVHKELEVREIKELDPSNHKYRPMHLVMVNKQNGRKSVLVVNEIVFNPNVKDEYFTTRYLERE
jgi:outer membrane lipoprotein-sorting protein